MTFRGTLRFEDAAALGQARVEVFTLLEGDDADLMELWESENAVSIDGLDLTIDFDIGAPGDWWFTLEAIVETYAEHAIAGRVDSWYDGEENESFGPDVCDD
jgi:hypothetical protein